MDRRSRLSRQLLVLALPLGLLGAWPGPARAADPSYDGLAEELARLRGDIEGLDARLEDQKESRRSQLRALAAQKSALDLELQREELRHQQLAERLGRVNERSATSKDRQQHLSQAVILATRGLQKTLKHSLPFQLEERRQALESIAVESEAGTLAPDAALDRLWNWVDEEMKLARESTTHKQVLRLDGEEVLAEVARLGMVALYFRTPDHRVGYAARGGEGWTWNKVALPEEAARIELLFAALDQGPAKGFFTLPGGALAGGEVTR